MKAGDEEPRSDPSALERDSQAIERTLTVLTTEHYTLQMVRNSTVSEASNRAAQYFATLSAVLIALGLIAQVARSDVILAMALVLLTAIYAVGLISFWRTTETSVEDIRCALGIARIRRYYRDVAPAAAPYFAPPPPGVRGVLADAGQAIWAGSRRPPILRPFLSTAGMINLVNGFVFGGALGVLASLAGGGALVSGVVGAAGAVVSIGAFSVHHMSAWRRGLETLDVVDADTPTD